MKKTKKKTFEVPDDREIAKAPDPTIPKKILNDWLEGKVDISYPQEVAQIKAGYLYEKGGVERYRIDVWASEPIEHMFMRRYFISHSWFVHFDQTKIIDKTLGQVTENKNKVKKLEGIADNNTRVGKSPW